MLCQSRGCKNQATWREVDKYVQQKSKFVYFYYMCDEHKEKHDFQTVGHTKKFQRILV